MAFTEEDFHQIFDADLWVIDRMLTLPSDPDSIETVIQDGERTVHTHTVYITGAMSQMREAVAGYRRNLLPSIFVITQKVHVGFFKLMLHRNGGGSSTEQKQERVKQLVSKNVAQGKIIDWFPFQDQAEFEKWWDGTYNFSDLADARNQIMHNEYSCAAGILTVPGKNGNTILSWTDNETLSFAQETLQISTRLISGRLVL